MLNSELLRILGLKVKLIVPVVEDVGAVTVQADLIRVSLRGITDLNVTDPPLGVRRRRFVEDLVIVLISMS